jgi:hypothetical protein
MNDSKTAKITHWLTIAENLSGIMERFYKKILKQGYILLLAGIYYQITPVFYS